MKDQEVQYLFQLLHRWLGQHSPCLFGVGPVMPTWLDCYLKESLKNVEGPVWWHIRLVLHLQGRHFIWMPILVLSASDPASWLLSGKVVKDGRVLGCLQPCGKLGRRAWLLVTDHLGFGHFTIWRVSQLMEDLSFILFLSLFLSLSL